MKFTNYISCLLLAVSPTFSSGSLLCQEKVRNNDYQPEQGQEGKDVRWFPTPQALVEKMLDMAKITPSDFLIDLGSGDGRTVITAAKRGVRAIGIEYDHNMIELSKKNAIREGVSDRVEFIEADLFGYDFSKATILTLFLLPEINLRLRPKILGLKPGTRIVSTTFTMQDWQFDNMVKVADNTSKWTTAYLWIVPAKVEGTWKFSGGELKLIQKFQMVTGEITREGKPVKISSGRLSGNEFTFSAGGAIYTCRATGNSLKGTVKNNGQITDWTAQRQK